MDPEIDSQLSMHVLQSHMYRKPGEPDGAALRMESSTDVIVPEHEVGRERQEKEVGGRKGGRSTKEWMNTDIFLCSLVPSSLSLPPSSYAILGGADGRDAGLHHDHDGAWPRAYSLHRVCEEVPAVRQGPIVSEGE